MFDQGLQFLLGFGTLLNRGTNLVEKVQTLVDLALGIGRVGTLLRRHGLALVANGADAQGAVAGAVAIAPATRGNANWTGLATNTATANPQTFTDTNAGSNAAFYRVKLKPNP